MRRYFLTVSDKNPIMFNDMLCEYCAVEIGPRHGGGGRCAWRWWWFVFRSLPAVPTAASSSPAAGFLSLRLCSFSRGSLADLKLSPPQTLQVYRVVCFVCKWPSTSSAAPVISLLLPVRTGQIVTFPFFAFHSFSSAYMCLVVRLLSPHSSTVVGSILCLFVWTLHVLPCIWMQDKW